MNVAAPSLHLLVIEADPADSRPIEQHLHHQGLSASTQRVASWPEIQAALGRGGWDAVLSDYNLPHLDFHDLLALLRDRHPDLPLILVSGRVGEEVAVELLKLGVWDFVLKDNLTRLVPALRRSLQDAADRRVRRLAEAELRGSRLAALNVMEDAVEARQQAEQVSAELRQEIIERQRTETAWRESEQRLRVLGDNLPGGALYQLVVEPGGAARYTYLSAGIERLFGIPADRVLADRSCGGRWNGDAWLRCSALVPDWVRRGGLTLSACGGSRMRLLLFLRVLDEVVGGGEVPVVACGLGTGQVRSLGGILSNFTST